MATARRGRRPKGDREPMHVRVPKLHKRVYEQAATAAGLPLGDYVAIALAEAHQLDKPDYVHREQEEALPLGA